MLELAPRGEDEAGEAWAARPGPAPEQDELVLLRAAERGAAPGGAPRRRRQGGAAACFAILLLFTAVAVWLRDAGGAGEFDGVAGECESEACADAADGLLLSLDFAVEPCDDFFAFACGRWPAANAIPDAYPSFSALMKLDDSLRATSRGVLEEAGRQVAAGAAQPEHLLKPWRLYDSCMNTSAIDAAGAVPLDGIAAELGLSAFEARAGAGAGWGEADWDALAQLLADLHRAGVDALFDSGVGADEHNTSETALYLSQSTLLLPSKEYYEDAKDEAARAAAAGYAARLLELWAAAGGAAAGGGAGAAAADGLSLAQRGARAVALEREVAGVMEDKVFLRDRERAEVALNVSELRALAPALRLDSVYLPRLLRVGDAARDAQAAAKLTARGGVVASPRFFSRLAAVLARQSRAAVADYLRVRLADSFSVHLGAPFRAALFELNKVLFQVRAEPARWQVCVGRVKSYLGFMLGRLFVDLRFSAAGKIAVEEMIAGVSDAFRESVRSADWMDDGTRAAALAKLARVRSKVGYPDWVADDAKLAAYYAPLEVDPRGGYMTTVRRARAFIVQRHLRKFTEPVDRDAWDMTPATANAYYSLPGNEMVFPAGVLQPPLFHHEFPAALSYGALGFVLSHELSHGFDDEGGKYDERGELRDWWQPAARSAFRRRAACLVDQYSAFAVNGETVNGNLTLGENIADNGAVRTAFRAFRAAQVRAARPDLRLPGLRNLSDAQLFFVGFASVLCDNVRGEAAHAALRRDVHAPGRFRVMGALQNSPDFARAFRCDKARCAAPGPCRNDPPDKCHVW